jgi:hypothetical protein
MRILLLSLIVLLTGCTTMPKTADEFRTNVSAFIMPNMEQFEVSRPIKDVTATLQKLAPKCLDKTVQRTASADHLRTFNWNPMVVADKDRTELHLQLIPENEKNEDMPPKGYYMMVVDAAPAPGNKTAITLYMSMKSDLDLVIQAIKDWAGGTNTKCVDMGRVKIFLSQ